jgi:hypothetical protein
LMPLHSAGSASLVLADCVGVVESDALVLGVVVAGGDELPMPGICEHAAKPRREAKIAMFGKCFTSMFLVGFI